MNFCSNCGRALSIKIPAGDDRSRYVCESCGMVHYQNPKMVVGCIPESGRRILLCKRAIEPRLGKWTIPAGYLENGETVMAGARRESFEEAYARFRDLTPYRLFNIRHVNQMYLIFRGELADDDFSAGEESLAVDLFSESEIPWDELAFKVISVTLADYFNDRKQGALPFQVGDILPEYDGDTGAHRVW
ncbi:MAG: NUDIX hydrolase [Desulfobacterales bacterium]|nr:NUDIX hydrolase [Desulfobacterales bacterium]